MLRLTPEFNLLVERYQQAQGFSTQVAALYELIALGYAYWLEGTDKTPKPAYGVTPDADASLVASWQAEAPDLDFALWFARRFAPQHGGKREGAGRKPPNGVDEPTA